jgi:polar amino acid transport system substrate-binding protein
MGIRPNRNLKVNFSIPYDHTGMSMVAHRKKAAGFSSLEAFNRPEIILAARLGSTAASAAQQFMPKAQLRLFDDEAHAYQELLNSKVHAVVGSAPTPAFQALKYPEKLFLPLPDNFTREPIGFAVRKGDCDALNFLDNWIRVVEAEGWLRERKHYWFETNEWESLIQ